MRILRERRQTFTGQPQKRLRERASDTMTSSRMFNFFVMHTCGFNQIDLCRRQSQEP